MKLPTPRKLPSGSWFCRVTVDGEVYSVTKETEKECLAEAAALKAGKKAESKNRAKTITLRQAIDKYLDLHGPTLSASTIRGYRIIQKNRFQDIMDVPCSEITQEIFQRSINADLRNASAKTIKNARGFVCSVLNEEIGILLRPKIPQVIPKDKAFLQPDELPRFLAAIKGSKHELPLLLCLHGLRVSETMNVRFSDIDRKKKIIHVRGAAVPDEYNILVHQDANKNSTSRRDVPVLIDRLLELLPEESSDEYVYQGSCSENLYYASVRACEKAGVTRCGVHDLRRTFASTCYNAGISEAVCMKLGGWKDPYTMRKIYALISDQAMLESTENLRAAFKIV